MVDVYVHAIEIINDSQKKALDW